MDQILLFTLLMIFFSALVGAVLKYRIRDRCLKALEGDFIILAWPDGKQAWGRFGVFHNALELVYATPHPDEHKDHEETSFILYKPQYGELYAVKRYHDELSEAGQARREKEIRRTYHPRLWRRWLRRIRNLFNLLRDAFVQSLGAFLGAAKKTTGSVLIQSQDTRLAETAKQLITAVPDAYEPILEQYIGRKVVVEVVHDGVVTEFCGILKEYTQEFLCLLDAAEEADAVYPLAEEERLRANHDLGFEVTLPEGVGERGEVTVRITDRGTVPICLLHAQGEGYRRELMRDAAPGESIELALPEVPLSGGAPGIELVLRSRRALDLVVPRTRGAIRHGAEKLPAKRFRFI